METNNNIQIKDWSEYLNVNSNGSYDYSHVVIYSNDGTKIKITPNNLKSNSKYNELLGMLWKFKSNKRFAKKVNNYLNDLNNIYKFCY